MTDDAQWWPRPCKKGVNNSDNQRSAVTVQRSTERFRNRSQLIVIQLNFIQPSTIFVVALCKTTWRRFTSTRVKPTQSAMGVIVANCDSNPCFCSRWTLLADLSHKGLKQRGGSSSNSLDSLFPFTALCSWLGMELGALLNSNTAISTESPPLFLLNDLHLPQLRKFNVFAAQKPESNCEAWNGWKGRERKLWTNLLAAISETERGKGRMLQKAIVRSKKVEKQKNPGQNMTSLTMSDHYHLV